MSSFSFGSLLQASERKTILDDLVGHGDGSQLAATALPQGTVRKHYKGYEEVIVPPMPTAPMRQGEKLVFLHFLVFNMLKGHELILLMDFILWWVVWKFVLSLNVVFPNL